MKQNEKYVQMIEIIILIFYFVLFLFKHFYNQMLVLRPIYNNVIKYLSFFFSRRKKKIIYFLF